MRQSTSSASRAQPVAHRLPLVDRRSEFTRQAILDAALLVLEENSVAQLTVRAIAHVAAMSERTVFRHFDTREALLDAVAAETRLRLALPDPPSTIAELVAAPRELYGAFEARSSLTRAALQSEIFDRMRLSQAHERWNAVRMLVDKHAPGRSARERRIAAANIRYYLSATCWNYYRSHFGFTLDDTIACAETAIEQSLAGIGLRGRALQAHARRRTGGRHAAQARGVTVLDR
ncbi:MAG: TetR/AcrR family transcriptional regulator [Burkholderiaceae bacterium]|nr:TetR/AcrR family transcriptional regulator [Burkholderiaceae bacterium]